MGEGGSEREREQSYIECREVKGWRKMGGKRGSIEVEGQRKGKLWREGQGELGEQVSRQEKWDYFKHYMLCR